MRTAYLSLAVLFASCAFLAPAASVNLVRVPADYSLTAADTTKTILIVYSNMYADLNLNGSNMVKLKPGEWDYVADGITPGWHFLNIVASETWVRNVPVYLKGGDEVQIDAGPNHLQINGKMFFNSFKEKNTAYSFNPMLTLNCYGCTTEPVLRFDGNETAITQPWITVTPGWHSIEIYSPLDHVQLYYRTLFDNYTITEFDIYPISTF